MWRWFIVADERILSFIQSFSSQMHESEYDAEKLTNEELKAYDFHAYVKMLYSSPSVTIKIFKCLPDDLSVSATNKLREVLSSLSMLQKKRISKTYAYRVEIALNYFEIYYASSFDDFKRLKELESEYTVIADSLDHMMWETAQFILYLHEYDTQEKIKKQILSFYSKYQKYLDVLISKYQDAIIVFCPLQLKGVLIGKQGATVKKLESQLNQKIRIEEYPPLTELYMKENPDLPNDPEVLQLLAQLTEILSKLEKKGYNFSLVQKIIQKMNEPEEEGEDYE